MGMNSAFSLKRGREEVDLADILPHEALSCPATSHELDQLEFRGLRAASTIRDLRDLCKVYKPALLFLSETKAKASQVKEISRKLQFQNSFVVDSVGRSGGLCLLWNNSLEVEVLNSCQNYIHAYVTLKKDGSLWVSNFVYGNPRARERRDFWSQLSRLHSIWSIPWCCLGDFNEVLSQSDKDGLHPINTRSSKLFNQFMEEEGLMDLDIKGCIFTWHSNPRDGFVTRERLDRILVNFSFRVVFPHALALAFPSISSDHSPLIFWPELDIRSGSAFKYEGFWNEHEDCGKVVQEGWVGESADNDPWERFFKRIKKCTLGLRNWHNKTFNRADVEISNLKKQLAELQNRPHGQVDWDQIHEVKRKIDQQWAKEEMFWGQRSRLKWLKYGDKNTRGPLLESPWPPLPPSNPSFFADDAIIFLKTSTEEFYQVTDILNTFSSSSGQKINLGKSGLIFVKFPKTFCDQLCSLMARFWWKSGNRGNGMHWKARRVLTKSKTEGGMGFKDFQHINTSLLAKQAWRASKNPDCLWVRILKALYFPNTDFMQATRKRGDSWVWASIMNGKDLIKRDGRWLVSTGSSIHISEDAWVSTGDRVKTYEHSLIISVSEIIDLPNHSWNDSVIQENVKPECIPLILQTPLGWIDQTDTLIWPYTLSGDYTVKSGYYRSKPDNIDPPQDLPRKLRPSIGFPLRLNAPQLSLVSGGRLRTPSSLKLFTILQEP
ncbi:Endonuclease/exonuclease/phosphatase superfamily [Sesbania bispinosa]|nr:Endonuclease/exonuclease/phosphatase superfamily [Sesbania bispinosa]